MSDIVERLRCAADKSANGGGEWYQLIHRCRDAADEIERLRAEVADMQAIAALRGDAWMRAETWASKAEQLRAAGDRLAELAAVYPVPAARDTALAAWREVSK